MKCFTFFGPLFHCLHGIDSWESFSLLQASSASVPWRIKALRIVWKIVARSRKRRCLFHLNIYPEMCALWRAAGCASYKEWFRKIYVQFCSHKYQKDLFESAVMNQCFQITLGDHCTIHDFLAKTILLKRFLQMMINNHKKTSLPVVKIVMKLKNGSLETPRDIYCKTNHEKETL